MRRMSVILAVFMLAFGVFGTPLFAQENDLDLCDRNSPNFDFNLCGWQWAGKLAVEKQELQAELAKLQKENKTLDTLYSLTRAELTDSLSREWATRARADENAEAASKNFGLYQETSKTAEQLGTIVVLGGLVALIIVVVLAFIAIIQKNSLREMRINSENDLDKLGEVKKVKNDAIKTLGIVIAERDKLRQRVEETEVDGYELVVKKPEKDLWLRDKDNPGTEHPFSALKCPGGEAHPKHTGPQDIKLKNARSHYKVEGAVIS